MINARLVDIDDLSVIDATDPATVGIVYRIYNSVTELYEFYLSDGATVQRIKIEDAFKTIVKQADETKNSNTTLANDFELKFTMEANYNYAVKLVLFFDTVAAADFKYAITGPSSPTLVRIKRQHLEPGGTSYTVAVDTAYTSSTSVTGAGTTGGYLEMDAVIQNGSNEATFAIQWAQDTSDAGDTTVLTGSYLKYCRMEQPPAP